MRGENNVESNILIIRGHHIHHILYTTNCDNPHKMLIMNLSIFQVSYLTNILQWVSSPVLFIHYVDCYTAT